MIDLTEHHLMIHILLAPIRRSTDPQAYVHNPNMIEYDWADGTPSDDSYIAFNENTSGQPRDICLSSSLCPYPAVVCVKPLADEPEV